MPETALSPTNEASSINFRQENSIMSKISPNFEIMSNPEQEQMLTEQSLEQIHQTLEEMASKANSEGVQEILEAHGS